MKEEIKPKIKKRSRLYIPWYSKDEEVFDEEEGDGWIQYIRRNVSHTVGEESPFPESSWSYVENDTEETKSDDQIRQEVMAELYENKDIDASDIKVIVLNGLVSLFGTVQTAIERKVAHNTVSVIDGVWSVKNELIIREEPRGYSHVL